MKLAVIRNSVVENVVEVAGGTWTPPSGTTTQDVSAVPCGVGWAHAGGSSFTPPSEPSPPSHTDTTDVRITAVEGHAAAPHAPATAQANADITKAEIEAKLTGVISSHSHAGGSAAWGGISGTLSAQVDLQGALDAKSATTHNHDAAYEAIGAVAAHAAAADPHAGYQRETEKGVANGYASLDAGGRVPSAQLPASGSDPWTYVVLGSDFPTTNTAAQNVTGLMFTPAANTSYEFVVSLRTRTATATTGPRPGVSWPTGLTDGTVFIRQTSAAGSIVMANGNINAAVIAPAGGLPNTTQSYQAWMEGEIQAGATPSGNVQVQLASETSGTSVTIKAGSFLRYRTVP